MRHGDAACFAARMCRRRANSEVLKNAARSLPDTPAGEDIRVGGYDSGVWMSARISRPTRTTMQTKPSLNTRLRYGT